MAFCPYCSCVCDNNRCPLCGEAVSEIGDQDDDEGELPEGCVNCDGRLCMSCVFREVHDECRDDCPFCCAGDEPDLINEPPHYRKHPSGVECIEVTEHFDFCLGNAIKYIWRSDHKGNQLADLQKARFYLDREITRLEAA